MHHDGCSDFLTWRVKRREFMAWPAEQRRGPPPLLVPTWATCNFQLY
jgi:hypothetical protein